jgi:hypothetical protein
MLRLKVLTYIMTVLIDQEPFIFVNNFLSRIFLIQLFLLY